jgi:hypothetical protein
LYPVGHKRHNHPGLLLHIIRAPPHSALAWL